MDRRPFRLRKAAVTVPVLPGVNATGSAETVTVPWYGAVDRVSKTRCAVRWASPVARTGWTSVRRVHSSSPGYQSNGFAARPSASASASSSKYACHCGRWTSPISPCQSRLA